MTADASPFVHWLWIKIYLEPQNNSANTKYDQFSGLFGLAPPDFEQKQPIGDLKLSLLEGKTREW